jgi:hypothetical protein
MNYLISHVPTFTLCFVFTGFCILIAFLGLFFARKKLHRHMLEKNHEVAASVYEIAGIIYSLILAFVIIAVWENYGRIDESIEKEGAKLGNIIVHAGQLDDTIATHVKKEVLTYADEVVKNDWYSEDVKRIKNNRLQKLRNQLYKFHPVKENEQRVLNIIDDLIDDAIDLRHDRIANDESHVPGLVWLILILGTCIAIVCSYLFSVEPAWLHYFYVFLLTSLIAMALFLIYMLDHPFEGSTQVSNLPFRELLDY